MNCGGMFFGNGSTCGGGRTGCGGNHITRQTSGFVSNSCGVGYTTVSCGGGGCGSSNGCGGNNSSLVDRFNQRRRGF